MLRFCGILLLSSFFFALAGCGFEFGFEFGNFASSQSDFAICIEKMEDGNIAPDVAARECAQLLSNE